MSWKLKYRCKACGYEAEVYEGRGLFRQQITPMLCPDCKTIQNIVVGGIIADVAPSYRSEVGRLCLQCVTDDSFQNHDTKVQNKMRYLFTLFSTF